VIRAEESGDTMIEAIDKVVDVLERQILKHKNKFIKRHRSHGTLQESFLDTYVEDEKQITIIDSNRFANKPMDAEEACMEMDLLGQLFIVFRNSESDEVNVVFKIKDDTFGLIEPKL
jgi:putative sigma-54 modulation protein